MRDLLSWELFSILCILVHKLRHRDIPSEYGIIGVYLLLGWDVFGRHWREPFNELLSLFSRLLFNRRRKLVHIVCIGILPASPVCNYLRFVFSRDLLRRWVLRMRRLQLRDLLCFFQIHGLCFLCGWQFLDFRLK